MVVKQYDIILSLILSKFAWQYIWKLIIYEMLGKYLKTWSMHYMGQDWNIKYFCVDSMVKWYSWVGINQMLNSHCSIRPKNNTKVLLKLHKLIFLKWSIGLWSHHFPLPSPALDTPTLVNKANAYDTKFT